MKLRLINTSDGSLTLYSEEFDETYHSVNGSITESQHVFINEGYNSSKSDPIFVLEIGFGTGLNAFLTFLQAQKTSKATYYHTIELFPVSPDIYCQLNYAKILTPDAVDEFLELHKADWNSEIPISKYFNFAKYLEDIAIYNFRTNIYDIIYFDAFSPARHPDAWTEPIFKKMFNTLKPGGIITTYCAKGEVRRRMQSAGFKVYRLPGPPGKREMLKGVKV
jgi:tRNA U34 5-methylaminomethyl-2-thiouridine-forming methyltransferase MnmC